MKVRFTMIAIGLLLALPATAATVPKKGDMAVSFNAGLADAFDDDFGNVETVFTGTFEYQATPRLSWRGLLGITSFDADLPGRPSVDVTLVNANVVYNWERGKIHPFVTGGLGLYDKSASSGLPRIFEGKEVGANAGGGIDWFLGPAWALKFEGTFHSMGGEKPDKFFLGTAGIIFWF